MEQDINSNSTEEKSEVIDENAHVYHTVDAKEVNLKDDYVFFPKNHFWNFISRFSIIFLGILVMPWNIIVNGYKIKGKKNYRKIKKGGAVLISNHVHPGDAFFTGWVLMNERVWVTTLQSNLGLPYGFGKFLRLMGCAPLPEKKNLLVNFRNEFKVEIEKKRKILVYPEAALIPFCDHLRPFKKGAFRLATLCDAPILPIVYTYRKPKGLRRIWRRKPCLTVNFLEPYYLPTEGSHADIIAKSMDDLHNIMEKFFNENTTYHYHKKEKKNKNKK